MSVPAMLRHRCDISRLQTVGVNQKSMSQLYTSLPCLFMPMSDRQAVEGGYTVGQAWTVYFSPATDIKRGDKLTYNGATYLVRGVRPYDNFGALSYRSAAVETEQANG
jgi:hypothetical protein